MRQWVLPRDGYICQIGYPDVCEAPGEPLPRRRLDVDHIIPRSHGGALADPANLRAACKACHVRKTLLESGRTPRGKIRDPLRTDIGDITGVTHARTDQAAT